MTDAERALLAARIAERENHMSTTFYDSPDGAKPFLTIDVTGETVWFFEHDDDAHEIIGCACASKEELPAIYKAMGEYLEATND